jgi:hypothetical protein
MSTAGVRPRAVREVALVAGLYVGYTASRLVADASRSRAVGRAAALQARERAWHLDVEGRLNRLVTGREVIEVAAAYWYSLTHYVVTAAVLVWLWRHRPAAYRRLRATLAWATAAALLLYLTLPLAPPRFLPGYTDTLERTSWAGWWSGDASAPRGLGGATDQLAAMPSMHVGWAVWVAIAVVATTASPWRHVAWLYPAITCAVVLGTANHWAADAAVGAVLVVAAWYVVARTTVATPGAGAG